MLSTTKIDPIPLVPLRKRTIMPSMLEKRKSVVPIARKMLFIIKFKWVLTLSKIFKVRAMYMYALLTFITLSQITTIHAQRISILDSPQRNFEASSAIARGRIFPTGNEQLFGSVNGQENFLNSREVNRAIEESIRRVDELGRDQLRAVLFTRNQNSELVDNVKIRMGFIATTASDILKNRMRDLHLDKQQVGAYLRSFELNSTILDTECPYDPRNYERDCNFDYPYRAIDGFCNNVRNPFWGNSHYPATRFLPSDYGDGLNELRVDSRGNELPNPRIISQSVLPTEPRPHSRLTNMLMVFGLIMDHEFALASSPVGFLYGKLKCCDSKNLNHPLCLKMRFPQTDKFFGKYSATCMEVVRALPVIGRDCRLGPRSQNNEVTSFIDASPIYGSTSEVANRLREFSRGLLKAQSNPVHPQHKQMLPINNHSFPTQCEIRSLPYKCFAAGDIRVNENSLLIVIHTLFFREHNRVAGILANLNPQWNDETLYQESRRIVIAEIQHICYNEFLPLIIGRANLVKFGLVLRNSGYFIGYNPQVDATVDHGFFTAAFRFGHSLINKDMFRINRGNHFMANLSLRTDFFQPQHIYRDVEPEGMDSILRGIIRQPTQNMDNHVVEDVRNHLFKLPHENFGMDLMALNLLRGREQGVPGYNEWREYCNLLRYRSWDDMQGHVLPDAIDGMRASYNHPDDVDLFIGGVSEYSGDYFTQNRRDITEGILGPTFSCILGNQFRNFRYGDRYWYENANSSQITHAFKPAQLQEIRKVTLSKIICDNSDTITSVGKNIFIQTSFQNPLVLCRDVPGIDFRHWTTTTA